MPDLDATDDRLSELRERWDRDRSSRVFVQLAEEYRRRGDLDSALDVLEEGLRAHPRYLSAQVALGRVRLELGQAAAARSVFERVTAQDPTHLLALKLLAESRLQLGDGAGAREALERYRLLGAPEEELEEIERRLLAGDASAPALSAPQPDASFAALAEGEPGGVDAGAWKQPTPAVAPQREPAPTPRAASDAGGDTGAQGPGGNGHGEVFRLPAAPAPPLAWAGGPGTRRLVARGSRELRLPPAEPLREVAEEVFTLWGRGARGGAEPVPAGAAEPVQLEEGATRDAAAELGAEGFVEASAEPAGGAPVAEASREGVVEAAGGWGFEPVSPPDPSGQPSTPEPATEPAAGEGAGDDQATTATLGEIYLRQGHFQEAARIFRQVLEREPGHPVALRGLERSAQRGEQDVTAERLLAGDEPELRGITARKILMLQRYLERIRRRAGGDVPGTAR